MNIQDRLTAHMRAEMARARTPNPGAVMDRGNEIKTRRRILAMAMPVAAVALVTVGVMAMRPESGGGGPANADQVAAANATLTVGTASFTWESGGAEINWPMQQMTEDGVMYVLSTAPGARWEQFPNGNVPKAVYTSTDGVHWAAQPTAGTWISSIGVDGGLLYAVGTGPGAAADSTTIQLGTSTDGGASFTMATLPYERTGTGFTDTRVLANDGSVLVSGTDTVNVEPDHQSGEVSQTTAEFAYLSTDGGPFEEVEHPFAGGWIDKVQKLGDTVVVSVGASTQVGARLMASNDLVEWREVAIGAVAWLVDIGMVGDEFVAVGVDAIGVPVVYRTENLDGEWVRVPLDDLLPEVNNEETFMWVNSAAVGPEGVAISVGGQFGASQGNPIVDLIGRVLPGGSDRAVEGDIDQTSALLVSRDLAEWTVTSSDELGGPIDLVHFSPQGDLVAQGSSQTPPFQRWVAWTPLDG